MNHEHDENQGMINVLSERLLNGIVNENPTFVLLLGMCPTLAVTTCAVNGLGMGLTTMVVLAMSNMIISALRKVIPNKIRIPAFIVIIASFVTIVELLLKAYLPSLYDSLGIYIPLIVVNCIILGRAESYAYSHSVLPSLFDGLGMGMGFSIALTIIGGIRELIGAGTFFNAPIMPEGYVPVSIFVMAPGAFFVLALLTAIQNKIREIGERHGKDMSKIQSGCGGNCLECNKECKVITESEDVDAASYEEPLEKEEAVENFIEAEDEAVVENEGTVEIDKTPTSIWKAPVFATISELKPEPDPTVFEEKPLVDEVKREETSETFEKEEEKPQMEAPDIGELELLDLDDYKKAIKKNLPSGKKPVRKKASREKAQAMLFKAEETMKEEEQND